MSELVKNVNDVQPSPRLSLIVHPNVRVFVSNVVQMISEGLNEISIEHEVLCEMPSEENGSRLLILGANCFDAHELSKLRSDSIIFNIENTSSSFFNENYIRALRKFIVWDFDHRNSMELSRILVRPVYYLPMFFVDSLARLARAGEEDIDVLFFGSFNKRRSDVLDQLRARGLRVTAVFGVFGPELDNLIIRAKVVINIHYYANGRVEIIRLFDLLANATTIVSELNQGEFLDEDLKEAVVTAPYEELADVTEALVRDPGRCAAVAKAGFHAFSARRASHFLRQALMWSDAVRVPADAVIGSGKQYNTNLLNIDIDARWHPDIVVDIADRQLFEREHSSRRFGLLRLQRGWFDSITASHVLEHIPDLVSAMSNCLDLLCDGGLLRITVPYDLSYGAWQDPTHVHAFNERSWLYYCEWYWYLGWTTSRFELIDQSFRYSPYGESLAARGYSAEQILLSPRAVDEMQVVLRKRSLTEAEIEYGRSMRGDLRAIDAKS